MLPILAVVAIAVCVWARWLARTPEGPRWARWIATVVAISTIATGAYSLWALQDTFGAVSGADPSDKAERLASGIASAFTVVLVGWVVVAAAIVALTALTIRRTARRPA